MNESGEAEGTLAGNVDVEGYAEIIERPPKWCEPLLEELHTERHPRWSSFAYSTSWLLPIIFPDSAAASRGQVPIRY